MMTNIRYNYLLFITRHSKINLRDNDTKDMVT